LVESDVLSVYKPLLIAHCTLVVIKVTQVCHKWPTTWQTPLLDFWIT